MPTGGATPRESAYRRIGARWWERALARAATRDRHQRRRAGCRCDETTPAVGASARTATTFTLADLKGLHYLRYLVERPGIDVAALALSDAISGHPGVTTRRKPTSVTCSTQPRWPPTGGGSAELDTELERSRRTRRPAGRRETQRRTRRADRTSYARAPVSADAAAGPAHQPSGPGSPYARRSPPRSPRSTSTNRGSRACCATRSTPGCRAATTPTPTTR